VGEGFHFSNGDGVRVKCASRSRNAAGDGSGRGTAREDRVGETVCAEQFELLDAFSASPLYEDFLANPS
jgi:hypothetical protein